jgi:hypothetical protein
LQRIAIRIFKTVDPEAGGCRLEKRRYRAVYAGLIRSLAVGG